VTGRSGDSGRAVVDDIESAGGDATFVRADMREPAEIEALIDHAVAEYGRIDVLVNNAGVQTETTAREATMSDWDFVLETDFRAFWLCAKHAADHMPEGGTILNTSSNHAFLTMPGLFPYNAVKAGINGMTRALALELGPDEITVNTINPGWIEIERTKPSWATTTSTRRTSTRSAASGSRLTWPGSPRSSRATTRASSPARAF